MTSRLEKTSLFEAIALMGKAFSSPRRLELLDLLAQGPATVDELARGCAQTSANTSQHLQSLHASGVVARVRAGTSIRYSLAGDDVLAIWLALRDAAFDRLGDVERAAREYLGEDVEVIDFDELRTRIEKGDVVLVDVRPNPEYEAGHIEGARNIPIDELDDRLAELPQDRNLVAYCRGPFCAYAHEAVRIFESSGLNATRLDGGWPEWKLDSQSRERGEAA